MSSKPVLAVDLDEVLCGTSLCSRGTFIMNDLKTNLEVRDFVSYNYDQVWGGTPLEAIEKIRQFYDSDHFSERMQPVPGAIEALQKLQPHYDLIIVTSRQEVVHEETHRFVNTYFNGVFKEIHFANHHLTPEEAANMRMRKKSEVCKEIGADILIDDALSHALDCLLFDHEGAYMWNKLPEDTELPSNVVRVHDWSDIVAALLPN
ncbi:hypothetical protein BC829DRAFT_421595 [Chytridium lagenaria]|nr:hypothetical protein BC829DRAFT_421595 [Chytridium lagenaria]